MNRQTWTNAAAPRADTPLSVDGVVFLGPDTGELAGKEEDNGRMLEAAGLFAVVAALPDPAFCVGFAAGSQDVERLGEEKRGRRKLPLRITNRAQDALGIDGEATILDDHSAKRLPCMSKLALARAVVGEIGWRLRG